MAEFTAEQTIKLEILLEAIEHNEPLREILDKESPKFDTLGPENIDEAYNIALIDTDSHWDLESEFRCSGIDTGLECDWSRHYESKSVAKKLSNGKWVGWTYWYGGGKHAEPEGIDWMSDAYFVDCKEEEKMVLVRTFSVVESDE